MSKIGFSISLLALIASNLCMADPASSKQSEEKNVEIQEVSYFGAQLGEAFTTSSDRSSSFTFSGRLGTGVYQSNSGVLSLGLFAGSMSSTGSAKGINATGTSTTLAAEIFGRRLLNTGLYFGGRFGIASTNLDFTAASATISAQSTSFAAGPFMGYEFSLSKNLNFTTDFSLINLGPTSISFPGVGAYEVASALNLHVQVGLVFAWGGSSEKTSDIRAPASAKNHEGQRWSLFEGWVDKK